MNGSICLKAGLLALSVLFSRTAAADPHDHGFSNTLSFNPVLIFAPNITYERALGERLGVFLTEGVYFASDRSFPLNQNYNWREDTFVNYNVAGLNHYLWGKAVAGLFWGPRFFCMYTKERTLRGSGDDAYYDRKKDWIWWAAGAAFGYHWVWDSGFSVGLEGGIMMWWMKDLVNEEYGTKLEKQTKTNMLPPYGWLNVGYSF